jgi:hypothetical protein
MGAAVMKISAWVYEQMVDAARQGRDVATQEFVNELGDRADALFGKAEVTDVFFSEFLPVWHKWCDALRTKH